MASLSDEGRKLVGNQWIPGLQQYFLEVPGAEKAGAFPVADWEVVERMGEPVEIRLEVTHPLRISRKHFLNRDATFVMSPADESTRRCSGFIASFSTIKTTADFTQYRLVIKSHLARLQGTRQSRIFQHQTAPQILETMLRGHGIPAHLITFKLRRAHPQHAFKFQYQQDDFEFFHMLMEKEGIYAYTVEQMSGSDARVPDRRHRHAGRVPNGKRSAWRVHAPGVGGLDRSGYR